jgi:hypothetical protein
VSAIGLTSFDQRQPGSKVYLYLAVRAVLGALVRSRRRAR